MPSTDPEKLRAKWRRQSARRRSQPAHLEWLANWREAHPEYNAAWREAHPEYAKEYRLKYPAHERARQAAGRARRAGILVKSSCDICGSGEKVEAHHAFGYSMAMALAVWWLCRTHHLAMHVFIRRSQ